MARCSIEGLCIWGNSELLDRRVAESGLSTLARAKLRLGNSPTADYPKGAAEACAQRTKADVTLGLLIFASFRSEGSGLSSKVCVRCTLLACRPRNQRGQ